jgi:hypothetical protein
LLLLCVTLDCIEKRDCARLAKDPKYRALRSRATVLVARDKQRSNSDKLAKSMNAPKLLWQIANGALGKNRPTLPISIRKPDGAMTVGDAEAAAVLNRSYVTKIKILRDRTVGSALATSEKWPSSSRPFSFSFASAGKIAKTIRGLKPTGALGVNTIPMEVLKKGVEVLAAPIAHMCNVSFATGVVPAGLKVGKITPVYKGSSKDRKDPASY